MVDQEKMEELRKKLEELKKKLDELGIYNRIQTLLNLIKTSVDALRYTPDVELFLLQYCKITVRGKKIVILFQNPVTYEETIVLEKEKITYEEVVDETRKFIGSEKFALEVVCATLKAIEYASSEIFNELRKLYVPCEEDEE